MAFSKEKNHVEEKFLPGENTPIPDLKAYEIDIYFKDFYGNPEKFTLKISMDLTRFDKTIYPLASVPLIHPYSDAADVACTIRCMKLEEIIATKLKCLMQRQNAPDLFDYAYSIKLLGGTLDRAEVRDALIKKTIFDRNPFILKGILAATDFDFFKEAWLKSIICAKQYWLSIEDAIATFLGDLEVLFAGMTDNGFSPYTYFPVAARATIMKAARTQTRLKVVYNGAERIIEPYALKYMQRRGRDPKEYFYVYNVSGGNNPPGIRQFVSESLQLLENTDQPFDPRYPIELSKAGEHPEKRFLFDPNKPMRAPTRPKLGIGLRRRSTSLGPKYVFQCMACGKRFTKKIYDGTLNEHKGKNGYPCYSRFGSYVTTKYS